MIPEYVHCVGFLGCFRLTCFPSPKNVHPLLGQAFEEVDFLKETHVLLEASTPVTLPVHPSGGTFALHHTTYIIAFLRS